MLTWHNINFVTSTWSGVDCHLSAACYNAFIEYTRHNIVALGVIERDYHTGCIRKVVTLDHAIKQDSALDIAKDINERLREEYDKNGRKFIDEDVSVEVIPYDRLSHIGYSKQDISYGFFYGNVLQRQ